ncbi:hypothetical protein [Nocardioides lijunqiniae]|uniref:hypothetical protein n=1 Tax=Nocardioides lijunqiniae TaxID=2760832 RepID=UPI0018783D7E|nr:hypothetical protein [Nocardioides lijunqiniae]
MTADIARAAEELAAATNALAEHERLHAREERCREDVADAARVAAQARASALAEAADVRALETYSPTRIWAALRGARDTELQAEQAEQQAAEYAAAQADARLAQVEAELATVRAARQALGDVRTRREQALEAKERLLREADTQAGTELAGLADRLGFVRSHLTELREASAAAEGAAHRLAAAADLLSRAGDWATYDTFLGGGMLTDAVKYDRMDQAQQRLREADAALRHLSAELVDVGVAEVDGVEVDGMTRTFDVWFDNIFSDWAVRDRIADARRRTTSAQERVAKVRADLDRRIGAAEADERALAARREELVAGA